MPQPFADEAADVASAGSARVAVLGGTGFIGRPLCAALTARGHHVLAIGRREPAVPVAATFVPFDVSDAAPEALAALFREHGVTCVINAAGGMWGLSDEEMVHANVTLVDNVLAAASALRPAPRVVQLGTVHEYGLTPVGVVMREDTTARPVMPYGELKLRCTERIARAVEADDLDAIVLRVGNVVGAGQPAHSLLGNVADRLSAGAGEGEPLRLTFATLGARRDFVDLDDVVDAVVTAAESTARGVFNVGGGSGVAARDMVRMLVTASGVPAEVVEESSTDAAPGEQWQCLDIGKADELLKWRPTRSLDRSMAALWASH
ncbi:NAD(P)-dependent oxidoreductase [Streptomyces sp. SID3343]|uniref:NAD-dependent epimerase/dehydratase family protein n=1 Tax=Streptomyces sp. SID3343 TaxID=2690260 RepID=UPI00136DA963|nr:NAD(P)-dependent oxidoreductase [Streptomyces sp. SID3343]MYW01596.1 NAD-dependent epimerase/dehydratase family protein [Streptomyces sp. SID3343]